MLGTSAESPVMILASSMHFSACGTSGLDQALLAAQEPAGP